MSRGTFVYIVTLAVFGTGLWAILSFGSILLRAPEELSGEWQLFAPGAGPDADPVKMLAVDQSGRFFKVRINGDVLDMTLIEERHEMHGAHELSRMVLNGKTARLTFEGPRRASMKTLTATGAIPGTWTAKRVTRHGMPDHRATPASQPAAPAISPHARLF